MLPRGATEDAEPTADQDVHNGKATKRVIENCDPEMEAAKYAQFVDKKALAVLRWNDMAERAANLEIPVYVNGIDDGVIAVSILPIPMRAQYLNIWLSSGHIERGPGDTFLMDPCAATVRAWEAMDRAQDPE